MNESTYPITDQQLTDLTNRFTYHKPKEGQSERYEQIRCEARNLALVIAGECPPSTRETALALTKLEEAIMWANASIARNE